MHTYTCSPDIEQNLLNALMLGSAVCFFLDCLSPALRALLSTFTSTLERCCHTNTVHMQRHHDSCAGCVQDLHGGVRDEGSVMLSNGLGPALGALLGQHIHPASGGGAAHAREVWRGRGDAGGGVAHSPRVGRPVYHLQWRSCGLLDSNRLQQLVCTGCRSRHMLCKMLLANPSTGHTLAGWYSH